MKKFIITFFSLILSLSVFLATTGFTINTNETEDYSNAISEKSSEDVETTIYKWSVDLVPISNDGISLATVGGGICYFELIMYDCRYGELDWSCTLYSDYLTYITGSAVIKRDWFGPYNPTLTTKTIKANCEGIYKTRNDVWYFDLGDTYKESDNIILQCSNFVVTGVEQVYTFAGVIFELQGEIGDFIQD